MKTIEIKVYKFEELDKQTREKVIDNYRNHKCRRYLMVRLDKR